LSIDSKRDLDGLLAVGRIVRAALQAMERVVRPGATLQGPDGWTLVTADGAAASHHEETIVITDRDPIVLTAAA